MSAQYTAFLDANVLYPAPLRDILIELAVSDLFQARWSLFILDEVKRNILKNRPDLDEDRIDRTIELMNAHTRDCITEVPDELISSIESLPDKDDRHVVAGALISRSHAIVTWNLRDFPMTSLDKYRLEPIDPDTFLEAQFDLDNGRFLECISRVRKRLKYPQKTVDEYLSTLMQQRLVKTATKLKQYKALI